MSHPLLTHQRQVHLDFHTSPHIPDVARDFDPVAFAETFAAAHVNSVTVFARCHHGMCYYPSSVGTPHPALGGRDLLGEQIEALHRRGIRAPIYTTVGWDEASARNHPEWHQLRRDGTFARCGNPDPSRPPHPGGWWFLNFLHPGYQDFLEAHLRELRARYGDAVDGIFFDILFFDPRACWSDASVAFREGRGLMDDDAATQARFEAAAQAAFAGRFTRLIQGLWRSATVFYNSTNPICADSRAGVRTRHALQTHWELESLPSGFWGYHHFPRLARAFGHWGKPWLGMTGRFQRMWGDFGGLKPQAALEFECFRAQAMGGANSVGDQLPPRGRLDRAAYDLIARVYAQVASAEPFYAGSVALPQVGIVAPGAPGLDPAATDLSLEGAVQLCESAHYDVAVLDDADDFAGLQLLILPDSVRFTEALAAKVAGHLEGGGKVIFSHRSGFDEAGRCRVPGADLTRRGPVSMDPTYWRADEAFDSALALSDRVVYEPGDEVEAGRGAAVLAARVLPYFKRTDLAFSSHFQAPPRAEPDRHAAVLGGDNWIYFADPVFREYRRSGNLAVRQGWQAAMLRLVGPAPFGERLPSTVLLVPRRRGADLILTLLHYVPTRRAIEIDTIDEPSGFAGETLRLPGHVRRVLDYESGRPLARLPDGAFELPARKGRLLLSVPDYFAGR